MNAEELKKLQDGLEKSIKDGVKALEKQLGDEKVKAQAEIDGLKAQLKDVSEKLAKLEALPARNPERKAPGILRSQVYKGYKIHKQASVFRKNPGRFENLRDDETIDEFSKFMITLSRVMSGKRAGSVDRQDAEDLNKFYEDYGLKTTMTGVADANGGYLVPDEFSNDIIDLGRDKTFALNKCTVIPMSSDKMLVPRELTLATMYWKTPSTQMTQGEPTFDQVQLDVKDLTGFAICTNQLLADSAFDIVSMLSQMFGYGIALEIDNQVLNGTGDPCSGVLTAAAGFSVIMSTGLTNFSSVTFDNVIDLIDKIPEGLDIELSMIFNKSVKAALRKVKDGQSRYLLNDPGAVTPGTIWEVPFTNSSKGPKTTTGSTVFISLGNYRYFYIGTRSGGMTVDVDPYGRFDYNETRFRMIKRLALKIAQPLAFARLITAA